MTRFNVIDDAFDLKITELSVVLWAEISLKIYVSLLAHLLLCCASYMYFIRDAHR